MSKSVEQKLEVTGGGRRHAKQGYSREELKTILILVVVAAAPLVVGTVVLIEAVGRHSLYGLTLFMSSATYTVVVLACLTNWVKKGNRVTLVKLPEATCTLRLSRRLARLMNLYSVVERAGVRWTRAELEAHTSLILLVTMSLAVIVAAIAYIADLNPIVSVAVLAILPALRLHLDIKASERAREVEEDLPYIALWAWILERTGAPGLQEALKEACISGLFPKTCIEANDRLDKLSRIHPSTRIRRLLSYYLTIRDTGGDTASFLAEVVKSELDSLKTRMEAYAENALAIGTAFIGAIAVLLVFSILASFTGLHIEATTTMLVVMLGIVGYIALSIYQPKLRDKYEDSRPAAVSILVAVATQLLALTLTRNPLVNISLLTLPLAVYTAYYLRQRYVTVREESELLPLLRLVIEYVKSAPDKPLDNVLETASTKIGHRLASKLREAAKGYIPRQASWLTKYTLYTLTRIARWYGVLDTIALERLYDTIYTHIVSRRKALMRTRMLGILAIGFPPVALAAVKQLKRLTTTNIYMQPQPITVFEPSIAVLQLTIFIASFVMGFLASKASSLTIRDTVWPLAALTLTLVAQFLA